MAAKALMVRVDKLKVAEQRLQHGLTYAEIAKIHGVTPGRIHQICQEFAAFAEEAEGIPLYVQRKGEILQAAERKLLASLLDPAKIEKASLNNVAYAFTQVHTAGRLERGQSTQNVGLLSRMMGEAHDRLFGATVDNSIVDSHSQSDAETPRQQQRLRGRPRKAKLTQ